MSITFGVDRVEPGLAPTSTTALPTVFERLVGRPLLACTDVETSLLTETPYHPLAAAVYCAFAEHRPLVLTPDAVWLTIAQGFAQHVNTHSERLRERFVYHRGRETLTVTALSLHTAGDWERVIDQFCLAMRKETKSNIADLMRCDFTTTTPITRVAGDVVLLDAFQRYFIYDVEFICGIPEVTMLGTVADWRKIEQRVAALAQYDLSWWTDKLKPVCRELRRTVQGRPNLDFWQSICMPEEVYGGEIITGWVARFFPYLEIARVDDGRVGWDGPSESLPPKLVRNNGLAPWSKPPFPGFLGHGITVPEPSRRRWLCEGLTIKSLPLGLSQAPVWIVDSNGQLLGQVRLVSGFVGVALTESMAVEPQIGWAVVEGHEPAVYLHQG